MFRKILITGIFLVILQSCGFTPIYKNITNTNFKIEIIELSGDRDTYNLIQLKLKNLSNRNGDKLLKIKINTTYSKESIAKDSSGKTTDYRVKIITNFQIDNKNNFRTISLKETFDFKKIDDEFTQLNYEKSVKENMANIIVQKLISQLARIK